MNRLLRRLYKLPWLQSEWTPTGYRLLEGYLANVNHRPKIEPMEKT